VPQRIKLGLELTDVQQLLDDYRKSMTGVTSTHEIAEVLMEAVATASASAETPPSGSSEEEEEEEDASQPPKRGRPPRKVQLYGGKYSMPHSLRVVRRNAFHPVSLENYEVKTKEEFDRAERKFRKDMERHMVTMTLHNGAAAKFLSKKRKVPPGVTESDEEEEEEMDMSHTVAVSPPKRAKLQN
jgi:hypothetical protein